MIASLVQPLLTIAAVLAALLYVGRSLMQSRGCSGCGPQGCGRATPEGKDGFVPLDSLDGVQRANRSD